MKAIDELKRKARKIKRDTAALYLAYKRPDMPLHAKILAAIVVGYALSPIDLIPDFIPVLGYLDDLVIVPLGIFLTVKLVPPQVMEECRQQAEELFKQGKPKNRIAAFIIILAWLLFIAFILYKLMKIWR